MEKAQILKVRNTLQDNIEKLIRMISTYPIEVWFEEEKLRFTFESEAQLRETIESLTRQLAA